MWKAAILDQAAAQRKLAEHLALTDTEVLRLMAAATHGKTSLSEADALRICDWALTTKVSAKIFALVMAGNMRVEVQSDGGVAFALKERAERLSLLSPVKKE